MAAEPNSNSVTEDSVITVASGNLITDAPADSGVARVASISYAGGTPVAVPNGGSATIVTDYGTLQVFSNGAYTYTINNASASVQALNTGANHIEAFTYAGVNGGGNNAGSAALNITVVGVTDAPVNNAPVATGGNAAGAEDTTINGQVGGTDADGDTLTYSLVAPVAGLTLNANGSYSYVPAADFNGPVTFDYVANDGKVNSAPVTVTITVNSVNDAPDAGDDAFTATEDQPLVLQATELLDGDSDVDAGTTLSVTAVSNPVGGTVTLLDGVVTFTPSPDFSGPASFDYTLSDGNGGTDTGTVAVTVDPINDAPVATGGDASGDEDTTITGQVGGTDVDGDSLTYTLVAPVTGLTLETDGSYSYVPPADFDGDVTFDYVANDGALDSDPVTVTITVDPANDAPVNTAPALESGLEDTDLVFSAANGNAVTVADADGDELTVTIEVAQGTLTLSGTTGLNFADGDGTGDTTMTFSGSVADINAALDGLIYRGAQSYVGNDTLTITTGDGTETDVDEVAITLAHNDIFVGTPSQDTFTATNDHDWTISGLADADTLSGAAGDDLIDGGAGADAMTGGGGNDTYIVDDAGDTVTEFVDGGLDIVESSVSYQLSLYTERLTLTGTGNINATGSALADVLTGNSGDNVLDGRFGADTMTGGAGDDTYIVNNAGDMVTELLDEGTDNVRSTVGYTLGAHLENLTLTGTGSVSGTGNDLNNVITGNQGGNRLDGGAGADTLIGGRGNDVYVIDAADTIVEIGGGIDTVESALGYTLGANFENLTLTGTDNINGMGNSLANELTGNSGNNVLDGGFGADTMAGGAGDDTYIVNEAGDMVTELDLGGTDSVQSSASHTLGAFVENLKLTGTGSSSGTGNDLDNVITGNVGANALNGRGGNDTLRGGNGADGFYFDTALGANNVDTIIDFSPAADTIFLDSAIFDAIGNGVLDADAFHKGATAQDAEDRIVYDAATGNLFYDADGSGAGEAILFATINRGTSLNHLDFNVYTGP